MAHWIRLGLLCRRRWTRKSDLWGKMLQSNIHYYERIKLYIVSIQELCLQKTYQDVPRKSLKTCQQNQDSCACTRFLCMHKILVHAQHCCACTTLLCMHWRGQGPRPGPKKSAGGPAWASALFGSRPWSLAPPVHAQECCACTRVLCMHKNLVHAQESWFCWQKIQLVLLPFLGTSFPLMHNTPFMLA